MAPSFVSKMGVVEVSSLDTVVGVLALFKLIVYGLGI
jgi:hypothetical protein